MGIARLVLEGADILLLDEPTNHLDIATLDWLVSFVQSFDGCIILISHDRWFLNQVCTMILEVTAEHTVESYHGNYDFFLTEREARYQKALAAYNLQQKERQRLEEWLARNRARATARPNPAL